jgi:hypothetical protein
MAANAMVDRRDARMPTRSILGAMRRGDAPETLQGSSAITYQYQI